MTKSRGKSARGKRESLPPRAVEARLAEGGTAKLGSFRNPLDLAIQVAVPVLFFLFVWSWHPFHDVFEFDPDEGNNVIKALMVAQGHPLYTETWSDQPPLFSYMLRCWFALTDWTTHQGRLMVLLCSSVLLWTLYQIVRPQWGRVAGVAAVLLLAVSYRYIALSVAVMLAMPTLMFAMLSIYALSRYRQSPRAVWMVVSGVFLALSLFTKMLTLPVAPLIFLGALLAGKRKTEHDQSKMEEHQPESSLRFPFSIFHFRPVLWWCGGVIAAGGVVVFATVPLGEFMQFISPHLAAQEKMAIKGFDKVFLDMLKADYTFAFLGVAGLLHVLWKRDWFSLLAVIWCLLAYVLLWTHRPLWYHHYPLLAIPLCWTAGIGVGALSSGELWRAGLLGVAGFLHFLWKRGWFSLLAVVWCLMAYLLLWTHRPLWYHHYPFLADMLCWTTGIGVGALFSAELWRAGLSWVGARSACAMFTLLLALGSCVAVAIRIEGKFDREHAYAKRYVALTASDQYTVAVLSQFKNRTDYVVTDRQMLAFAAGMMVPPELSVTSVKRMRSGSLSMEMLIGFLEQYKPGVIHLSWRKRIPMTPELRDYLKERYSFLYSDPRGDRCFVCKSLDVDPMLILERASEDVPESWEGHLNFGVHLLLAGRYADAERDFESSIAIKPSLEAYRGLGESLKRLGRYQEAANAYEILGLNLKRMKREDQAANALEEAKQLRAAGG